MERTTMDQPKLQIYKGIIHYLLESTNYNLKNIADLTSSSIKNLRSIYIENCLPENFPSEIHLIRLFQMVLEINNEQGFKKYVPIPKQYRNLYFSME
jgi:hypothetical protein